MVPAFAVSQFGELGMLKRYAEMKDEKRESAVHRQKTDLPEELCRPGRDGELPLSLLDQIELGTLDVELAAWLVSHISRGASFIVGAESRGVGKTTTMRSLLGFAPGHLPFAMMLPGKIADLDGSPHCAISYELSDHAPPAYLWAQDLRDYFALSGRGHMLVGNMHADDLDQARAQICKANDVPEAHFRAIGLFIFVRMEGESSSARRSIETVYHSDGAAAHQVVFSRSGGLSGSAPRDPAHEKRCRAFLTEALAGSSCVIEEVRRRFLDDARAFAPARPQSSGS